MTIPSIHDRDLSVVNSQHQPQIPSLGIHKNFNRDTFNLMTNILNGNNNINTIRFILALMVLWSHSFAFYFNDEKREPIALLTRGLYNAGNLGVSCFLIMSGALIYRSWETSLNFKYFFIKRAKRLYPAYLAAMFFGAFIVAPIYAEKNFLILLRDEFLNWLLANLFFRGYAPIDNIFVNSPIQQINGSLWSIWYEVVCYVFLVIGAVLLRARFVIGCWIAMVVLTAAKIFADVTGWNPGFGIIGAVFGWPYLWFSVAGWFITGILFYLHRDAIPRHPILLTTIGILWISIIWLPETVLTARILMDMFYTPMLAYLLFYIGSYPRSRIENVTRTYDLSYGMYLYAFPTQQIILAELSHQSGFPVYIGLSVIFTIILSMISWIWIERRFIRSSTKPVKFIG